jgi:hypothetical protein
MSAVDTASLNNPRSQLSTSPFDRDMKQILHETHWTKLIFKNVSLTLLSPVLSIRTVYF